ncbi:MAG TPA: hypothetical protein RMH99_21405 [Sandaracinaceae bacterium LLY-WYZ-13_1]|nr:hypothetical protein [Sandaracinaceae bacterium LLY-WYZ-13_1]
MRTYAHAWSAGVLGLMLATACDGDVDDRPEGPADMAAMALCDGFAGAAAEVTAASSAAEAADVVIERDTLYEVTLPAGAEGVVMLRSDTAHADLVLGASPTGALATLEGGLPGATRSAVCPDVVADEHRVHVHEPGDYALTFSAEGERTVRVYLTMAGHGHGTADGGHMHHDHDGGHVHHEGDGGHDHHAHDGGHAHDHDGGACSPAGASCASGADCCSGHCHGDHCH